jgi:hypothetical protein
MIGNPQLITESAVACRGPDDVGWFRHAFDATRHEDDPRCLYRLADLCRRRGYLEVWRKCIETAFKLNHVTEKQIICRGRAKLTLGDWSGWSDLNVESRHFLPGIRRSTYARLLRFTRLAWNGASSLRDRTLLVIHEAGYGDTIQMLRFIPQLANDAARIVLLVQPELVDLAVHNFGDSALIGTRDPTAVPKCDYYVWTMSLPAFADSLPRFVALTAPNPRRLTYGSTPKVRVGLCWAGNPSLERDARRSIPLAEFKHLFGKPDVEWYSLYVGCREYEARSYPLIVQTDPRLHTFADTANLISGLDCVVTCDTAVGHLAGSLGIPTFLLVDYASEYRWGLEDTTSWYPSVRIVRQRTPGDWVGAIDILEAELTRFAASVVAGHRSSRAG